MAQVEMSLHRVIAEIKSQEAKLAAINSTSFVATAASGADGIDTYKKQSQAAIDKISSAMKNLAALKAARNKANTSVVVKIAGKELTIDEALSQKAALPYKQQLVNVLQSQYNQAEQLVKNADAQIEQKVNQNIAQMFSGTKKATEDEIALIRNTVSKANKQEIVATDGLKTLIDNLKKEIEEFTTEVDFVLSEANATNKVFVEFV